MRALADVDHRQLARQAGQAVHGVRQPLGQPLGQPRGHERAGDRPGQRRTSTGGGGVRGGHEHGHDCARAGRGRRQHGKAKADRSDAPRFGLDLTESLDEHDPRGMPRRHSGADPGHDKRGQGAGGDGQRALVQLQDLWDHAAPAMPSKGSRASIGATTAPATAAGSAGRIVWPTTRRRTWRGVAPMVRNRASSRWRCSTARPMIEVRRIAMTITAMPPKMLESRISFRRLAATPVCSPRPRSLPLSTDTGPPSSRSSIRDRSWSRSAPGSAWTRWHRPTERGPPRRRRRRL